MPTAKDIQTQVIDSVKKGQDTVVTTVKGWTETVNKAIPEINVPFAEQIPNYVPQAKSAVNSAFDVAERAVTKQREVVINVLDVVESRLNSVKTKSTKASPKSTTKDDSTTESKTETKAESKTA